MQMTDFRTLGRSGLITSPLALGTMTFGADRWGADEATAREIFETYLELGGNLIDTADVYSGGESERMLGRFLKGGDTRDRIVLSTKSGFPRSQGHPMHGGNGAKNIRLGIEGSLTRLGTDYIDLYWMHVWDRTTPAEEVVQVLTDAVRAGKILYYGFSNTPAWYVARVATLARAQGLPAPVGLQYSYSLIDRGVELELALLAAEMGLGLVPWSPLSAGLLTGKYGREMLAEADRPTSLPDRAAATGGESGDRLRGENPFGGSLFTERNFDVVDVLREVAEEAGRPMAQVALAWLIGRPAVGTILVGASRGEQLRENAAALAVELTHDQRDRLDQASMPPTLFPYAIFQLPRQMIFGGMDVTPAAAL